MAERRSCALVEPTGIATGDHICWSYGSDDEHRRVITAFLLDGLEAGDRIAYFGARGGGPRALEYLRGAGADVETLLAEGRLLVGAAEDAYTPDGVFDPDDRIAAYRALVEQALADGYRAFRVAAEAAWLLHDHAIRQRWAGYELRADLLSAEVPFIAMCCYDARGQDAAMLALTSGVHALTLNVSESESAFRVHATGEGALSVVGELDAGASEGARAALLGAATDVRRPTLDLSRLAFVDVAGMRALVALVRSLADRGQPVELYGASPMFRRMWDLLELDRRAEVIFN